MEGLGEVSRCVNKMKNQKVKPEETRSLGKCPVMTECDFWEGTKASVARVGLGWGRVLKGFVDPKGASSLS